MREQWQRRAKKMWSEPFSARTLDVGGSLNAAKLRDLRRNFTAHPALHVQNTGLLEVSDLLAVLAPLGFSEKESFVQGGRTSAQWQEKWVEPGLRRMDFYPPSLYLLPNNEVQYQHSGPHKILFFCRTAPQQGGRTFLHSAAAVEAGLAASGALGEGLLEKLERHGLTIETGFLDRGHPQKSENYFQSWQERFATEDPLLAIERARAQTNEYDLCWWRGEPEEPPTLMTRITRPGFQGDPCDQKRYLRFPRLALDPPSAQNGYRRFPLGDGSELSADEQELLREVYFATREGTAWHRGDLILFDNIQYGHSRESFEGDREVFIAMTGEVAEVPAAAIIAERRSVQYASAGPESYILPTETTAWSELFSARTFDVGALSSTVLLAIREQFARYGVLHLRNTGLKTLPDEVLEALGFGAEEVFPWGGMSSGRTTRRPLNRTLRATDDYPGERWLLPHNEVLYQRQMPSRVLFFSASATDPSCGGRTFVHSALRLEEHIRRGGPPGEALLDSLRRHGLLIEMGFLDERSPEKEKNYFRSWQDRFETTEREEAIQRCRASTLQFDEAWWRQEANSEHYVLMTRIQIPTYCYDPSTQREYLMFPRIALDAPQIHNGYRRYPKGNGEPFTNEEIDLLLEAFLATREGVHYQAGDLLLVDNIRYGHSRESFTGAREIGVSMAGCVSTEGERLITASPQQAEPT